MCGDLLERHGGVEREVHGAGDGVKPTGLAHANVYGSHGALVFSVNVAGDSAPHSEIARLDNWRWTAAEGGLKQKAIAPAIAALADGPMAETDQIICDVLALSGARPAGKPRPAPPWLGRVREQLRDGDEPLDLTAIANECGVHRVSLSRAFMRCFAMPPSVYRARSRLARAVARCLDGARPVEAALNTDFGDQSHFTRMVKSQIGLTPGRLRALFGPA